MMKRILFAALAATTLFASCAKENENANINETTGTITVTLKGSGDATRADVSATVQTNDATIFVFDGDKLIDSKYLNAKGTAKFEEITTSVDAVYVVGNIGTESASNMLFSGVTTLTQLKAMTHDFDATNSTILQGNAAISFTSDGDGGFEAKPVIKLRPLAARIDVSFDWGGATGTGAGTKMKWHDVSLLYGAQQNHYVMQEGTLGGDGSAWINALAEGNETGKYYYSGLDHANFSTWAAADHTAVYSGAGNMSYPYTLISDTSTKTFYAYPGNNAYGKHTIITLRGEWSEDNFATEGEAKFFSAHFNGLVLPVLENGRYYTIKMVMKGKFNGNEDETGGGEDDPEDETTTGDLDIIIEEGEWIVVDMVNVVFE